MVREARPGNIDYYRTLFDKIINHPIANKADTFGKESSNSDSYQIEGKDTNKSGTTPKQAGPKV